jgi:hypothetical protein
MTTPPVFIVGAPRSGTSLLYRLLQFHDAFKLANCATSTGVELTETRAFSNTERLLDPANKRVEAFLLEARPALETFRRYAKQRQRNAFLPAAQMAQRAATRFNAPVALRKAAWTAAGYAPIVRAFFDQAIPARGCRRLLEKTPQHIFFLPEIDNTYPDAKLVFVHRHPVQVLTSHRRRYQDSRRAEVPEHSLNWLRISKERFSKRYRHYMTLALDFATLAPYRLYLLPYEQLVAYPEETLSGLLHFLHEPFQSKMLDLASARTREYAKDPKLFRGIDASQPGWQEHLTRGEAEFLESSLTDILARVGYERLASS